MHVLHVRAGHLWFHVILVFYTQTVSTTFEKVATSKAGYLLSCPIVPPVSSLCHNRRPIAVPNHINCMQRSITSICVKGYLRPQSVDQVVITGQRLPWKISHPSPVETCSAAQPKAMNAKHLVPVGPRYRMTPVPDFAFPEDCFSKQ